MEDSSNVAVAPASQELVEQNPRLGWVEKHAELITKLEAEYQQPQGKHEELQGTRYYAFSVAGLNLLIPNDVTSEVLEENVVHNIPLAPKWLLGACNVRGDVVPILDLYQILNHKKTELNSRHSITLILGSTEKSVGVILGELPKAVQFKKEQQIAKYSKVPEVIKPFISIAYKSDHKLWLCIDFPALIASFTNTLSKNSNP